MQQLHKNLREVLASLHRLYRSAALEPFELQELDRDIIQPLEDVEETIEDMYLVTDASIKFPKKVRFRNIGGSIKWVCCAPAVKSRTRKGKAVWKSWCQWKKGKRTGGMVRVVGEGSRPKPNKPLGRPVCS